MLSEEITVKPDPVCSTSYRKNAAVNLVYKVMALVMVKVNLGSSMFETISTMLFRPQRICLRHLTLKTCYICSNHSYDRNSNKHTYTIQRVNV